ncbi:MAG: nuclear transport factor 2 family protein [Pseudomonadota bacterium]
MNAKDVIHEVANALFFEFDTEALSRLLTEDYIQHNPGVPTGKAALLGVAPALASADFKTTVHRVIAEDDLVVVHSTFDNADLFGAPTLVSFDVFRVENGKAAEHWDNLQPPPATTPSGRSMTDGPTQVVDLNKTEANKALVQGFIDDVFLAGRLEKAADYIVSEPGAYQQHNPGVADGLDKLGEAFATMQQAGNAFSFSKLHRIIAEGNFVFTMTEGAVGATPSAFFDLWRVEDGRIVEHWDTISAIPDEMAHNNGKF